jgi:O-antigen ligase
MLLVGLTFLTIPNLLDQINLPKFFLLSIGGGAILTYLILNIDSIISATNKFVLIIPIVFSTSILISGLASEQSFYKTLVGSTYRNNGFLTYFFLSILFIFISINKSIKLIYSLILSFAYSGVLLVCIGLIQRSEAAKISSAAAAISVKLTLGNIDYAAALLGITGTLTFFLFLWNRTSKFNRIIFFCSLYLHYILLFDSPAKQGRVIFIIGLVFIFGLWLSTNSKLILQKLSIAWWITTFIIFLFSVGSLFKLGPLKNLFNDDLSSLTDRYYPFLGAINIIKSKPIFGVGIDSFGDWYPRYNSKEGFNQIILSGGFPIDNPHNVYLNFGATGGITLLLSYLAFNSFVLYRGISSLKKNQDSFLAGGLLTIWLLFQAQSLISIDQIGLSCWGWGISGCIVSLSYLSPTENHKSNKNVNKEINKDNIIKKPMKIILLVFVISQLPSMYLTPIIKNHIELGIQVDALRVTSDQNKVKPNADKLLKTSLLNRDPYYRANIVRLLVQFNQLDSALILSIDSTKKFPLDLESWNTLAKFYEATGQKRMAVEARRKTVELDPMNLDLKKILEDDIRG